MKWKNRLYMLIKTRNASAQTKMECEIFLEKVDIFFSFLKDYGFKQKSIKIEESRILGWVTEVYYKKKNREVTIDCVTDSLATSKKFFPHFKEYERPAKDEFISCSIVKEPYDSVDNFISFDLYIARHKPDFDMNLVDLEYYKGTFEERVEKVLQAYASLMKESALDIIKGERWESGLYHPKD